MTSPLGAYGIRKQRQNLRSKFFKHIHLRSTAGMHRREIMMRWLGKNRYMNLMNKMSSQLQSGDSGWIGSLNLIMKLVGKHAQNNGYKIPREKIMKVEKIAQRALMHQHSVKPFFKCLDRLDARDFKDDDEIVLEFGKAIGQAAAHFLHNKLESGDFQPFRLDTPRQPQPTTTDWNHVKKDIKLSLGEISNHPTHLIISSKNPINRVMHSVPESDHDRFSNHFVHILANQHGLDPRHVMSLYSTIKSEYPGKKGVVSKTDGLSSLPAGEPFRLSLLAAQVHAHPNAQTDHEAKALFGKVLRFLGSSRRGGKPYPITDVQLDPIKNVFPVLGSSDFDEEIQKRRDALKMIMSKP
jgi:hypothetical protein